MNIIKQLDKLVTKSFIGPYIIAFVVAEFVLVLQFIWRYIDDFIGRGVSPLIISEMVFYYSITIIPLAVPISILISSVMVYGTMAEKYELTSFKSAGVSFYRIMRPGIVIAILTGLFSIFSSNYLKPKANLSFYKTFDNVRRAKPTLTIDQGIFNYDFKGYAIRVGKKHPDGSTIEDVLIYDQTDRRLLGLITAKSGKMFISEDGMFFTMELYDGVQYSEMERNNTRGKKDQNQFVRIYFDKFIKKFDMSEFEFSISQDNLGRRKHDLYNTFQMKRAIDSIESKMAESLEKSIYAYGDLIPGNTEEEEKEQEDEKQKFYQEKYGSDILADDSLKLIEQEQKRKAFQEKVNSIKSEEAIKSLQSSPLQKVVDKPLKKDVPIENSVKKSIITPNSSTKIVNQASKADKYYLERVSFRNDTISLDTLHSILQTILPEQQRNIVFRAKSTSQTVKERYRTLLSSTNSSQVNRNKFELRMHQQLCWAAICIVFLFIGAPLGSIVRKGGFGYPLLVAIVFFVIFIFSNILGEKLVNNGTMNPIIGAWLPCIILTPLAILFTWKAIRDSKFNFNFNIFSWFKS